MEDVGRALEGVRTRLGDGVHATADEVGLTHVVRSNDHLHFLNSLNRNRVATTGQVARQTKVVIEVGTVNGEVGRTSVTSGKGHAITAIRRQASQVGDGACHCRQRRDLCCGDVGGSTHLFGHQLRCLTADNHFAQLRSILSQHHRQAVGFTQLQRNARNLLWLIANVGHCYLVWTARTHTLNAETTVDVRHCIVASARRCMHYLHRSTDNLFIRAIECHLTGHT